MKAVKTILGAVACVAAGGVMAQTNVQVLGTVDMFAGSLKNSGDAESRQVANSGGMTTSWFGFKGTEDLGAGLKAEVALTGFFQADTGASGRFGGDTLFSRDANVGLVGDFGAVRVGRAVAPSFLPTILFNPFGDSFTFSPLVTHSYVPVGTFGARRWVASNAGDSGWSNQLIYSTPNFGGLTANVHYQFGEVAGDNGVRNVGINALYFNGPLGLTAFYHDVKVSNPVTGGAILDPTAAPAFASVDRQQGYMLGASYDLKFMKLFGTFHSNDNDTTTAASMEDKVTTFGLSAPFGQGAMLFDYARTKRSGSLVGADIKRDTFSVGYDYNLSKRTDVYAVLMSDKITGFERGNSFGAGIRHKF